MTMTSFQEADIVRDRAGRFDEHVRTAPEVGLTVSPAAAAQDFLAQPAPEGSTEATQRGWNDANQYFGTQELFQQQPLSYIAFQSQQAYEHAEHQAERNRMTIGLEGDHMKLAGRRADLEYWEARTGRLDDISEEFYRLADKNRYPNRDPETIGTDPRDGTEVLRDTLRDAPTTTSREPVGLTATRASLRNAAGDADGAVRMVSLTWDSVPPASDGEPLQVVGPKDGRPLVIDVRSGCPTMTVASGHAVIVVGGSGFGITVAEGAKATILPQPGQKVSVTAEEGSNVDFYAESDNRGYQVVRDGAKFQLHGRADKVGISTDRDERP